MGLRDQADLRDRRPDAFGQTGTRQSAHPRIKAHCFEARQVRIEIRGFRQVPNGPPRFDATARDPKHPAVPRGRREQAKDDLEQGALAGTVWPEQRRDLARFDSEADSIQGPDPGRSRPGSEVLGYARELDGIHGVA